MKKLFVLLLSCVFLNSFSQDLITLKNGEQIETVIVKITDDTIEYRKFDNQVGPIYSTNTEKVLVINYANGTKDVFNSDPDSDPEPDPEPIILIPDNQPSQDELIYKGGVLQNGKKLKTAEIRELYAPYPDALKEYNKSKPLGGIGITLAIIGGATLGYGLGTIAVGGEVSGGVWAVGGVATTFGLICGFTADSKVKKSVGIYNEAIKQNQTSSIEFNFGFTQNGFGLLCRF